MPAQRRNFSMRISCAVALVVTVLGGMAATGAKADALDAAFPAPDWRREKSQSGLTVDCVGESCGPPAHVAFNLSPANSTMADRIKSGMINREWAEKLAASFQKSQGDRVTVLSFTVQAGQNPGWSMVYECNCDGAMNYVSSRVIGSGNGTITFYSLARTAESAEENMSKLAGVILGASGR
jgi:hypothetical protein